jgi:hypothetical protein
MKKTSSQLKFFTKRQLTRPVSAVLLSLIVFHASIAGKAIFANEPFSCNDGIAYQTINSTTENTSSLYGFDVTTGAKTLIATLPYVLNGLTYNSVDNMLWASRTGSNNIVRIDKLGGITSYPIVGLPSGLNVGAELPGGYMLLYNNNHTHYYVVDLDPESCHLFAIGGSDCGVCTSNGPGLWNSGQ